jgi:glycosyltransferase involved in cell wall biosynthesis
VIVHGVTDNDLYPARFGASQRLFGLYRGLARAHEVTVLCVVPNRNRGARADVALGVRLVRRKAWYTAVTWRLERARLMPLFLAAYGHWRRADRLLAELEGPADVCMADLSVAGVLERRAGGLRVYHAHNVEADHFRAAGPRLLAASRWADRLEALERRAIAAADLVVAASEEDAERFRALYDVAAERLAVIPNGYDETEIQPPSAAQRERARAALGFGANDYAALFVGSDVPHNRAALALLVERVMPKLAGAGIKLMVVGRVSAALSGRSEPWLVVRPEVPDLAPFLHAADAGVNPMTRGGGSNVKLPAYLAAGLAVVSTPFGVRGYAPLAPWVSVAAADDLAEALIARPVGWCARGESAPDPLAGYAWGRLGESLGHVFAARLGAPAASGESSRLAAAGGRRG